MFSEIMGPESVVEKADGLLSTGEEKENVVSSVICTVPLSESGGLGDQTPNIEVQVNRFLAKTKIETDHREPQKIDFTDDMKKEIKPILEEGLKVAAEYNKKSLLAHLKRGEFLAETQLKLRKLKLRVFRTICAECQWSKSSAYAWIKLYKSYGEHLADYSSVAERKLKILTAHPKAMELLDKHLEEIESMNESSLRQWVKEQLPGPQPARRARGVTQIEIGHFLVTRGREKTNIKGLTGSDFEALVEFLETRTEGSFSQTDEVSTAVDTQEESNESDDEFVDEVVTDSTDGEQSDLQIAASLAD